MPNFRLKKIAKALVPYGALRLYEQFNKNRQGKILCAGQVKPLVKKLGEPPLYIVTLTSYGKRVKEKAPLAIRTIFNQSVQPDRIVLYLAHGTVVPNKLKELGKAGLEIRFCDDIKSYKKLLPALRDFPDDVLVSADDDVFYPANWFKMLKETHVNNPQKICCHRAHEICLDEDKNIIPYNEWRHGVKTIENPKRLFPTGCGGILYPPRSFNHDVFDIERIKKLAPLADDVWFWAMARQNGKEHTLVKNCINRLRDIGVNTGLRQINVWQNKNDEYIKNVIKAYPGVYKSVL